jgi:hypothetical protein
LTFRRFLSLVVKKGRRRCLLSFADVPKAYLRLRSPPEQWCGNVYKIVDPVTRLVTFWVSMSKWFGDVSAGDCFDAFMTFLIEMCHHHGIAIIVNFVDNFALIHPSDEGSGRHPVWRIPAFCARQVGPAAP